MKHFLLVMVMFLGVVGSADARPRGSSKSSSSSTYKSPTYRSSSGYGTGSKSSSTSVRGYTTKSGTYVAPYRRTTSDGTQRNNYSTKSNYNPYTGRTGTKPARR